MTYWTVLSDDTSGTILQTSNSLTITATLLPRGANEPPHAYRIEIVSGPIAELRPEPLDTGSLYGEYAMMGTAYTGVASQDLGQSCANLQQTAWGPYCYQVNQYLLISALDQARMDFSFTTQLATAANAQQPLAPVSYVSANVLSSGVMSWDSGDDDLPGPN